MFYCVLQLSVLGRLLTYGDIIAPRNNNTASLFEPDTGGRFAGGTACNLTQGLYIPLTEVLQVATSTYLKRRAKFLPLLSLYTVTCGKERIIFVLLEEIGLFQQNFDPFLFCQVFIGLIFYILSF